MVKRSREDSDLPPNSSNPQSHSGSSPSSNLFTDPESSAHEAAVKLVYIDTEGGEPYQQQLEVMRCSLPPHRQTMSFTSFEEYEVHYNKTHVNRCSECRKNFPTTHFLDLHISENHDPLVEVLKERGQRTYSCFVEDCDRKCSTPNKRRMHLIDKHMFPRDYDFYIVNDGIDQRNSMLRSGRHRRRSSAAQHKTDIEEKARRRSSTLGNIDDGGDTGNNKNAHMNGNDDDDDDDNDDDDDDDMTARDGNRGTGNSPRDPEMERLVGAMSSLKFIPPSVRFGRGRGKGGFSRT